MTDYIPSMQHKTIGEDTMENKDKPGLSTENKIYLILVYLAVIAYCGGMIWFSASCIVHSHVLFKDTIDPIHFVAIVFYSLLILAATVFMFFRLKKENKNGK